MCSMMKATLTYLLYAMVVLFAATSGAVLCAALWQVVVSHFLPLGADVAENVYGLVGSFIAFALGSGLGGAIAIWIIWRRRQR